MLASLSSVQLECSRVQLVTVNLELFLILALFCWNKRSELLKDLALQFSKWLLCSEENSMVAKHLNLSCASSVYNWQMVICIWQMILKALQTNQNQIYQAIYKSQSNSDVYFWHVNLLAAWPPLFSCKITWAGQYTPRISHFQSE